MNIKKLLSLVLIFVLCAPFCMLPVSAGAEEKAVFVSPDGSDINEGTKDAPLATLSAAKEKIKTADNINTVYFRGGTYTFDGTVDFTSLDKSDVTYKAYNGEKVVFTAGTPYTGFEECTVNGVKAFKKEIGTGKNFNVLFNEETTLRRTRYPEKGYLYPAEIDESYCINPEQKVDANYSKCYTGMVCKKDDISSFKNPGDIVARILHFWKDEMLPVESIDASTGVMRFTKASSMTLHTNERYFLENVFEALNEPGEWYLDKPEGVLYYVPHENETAEDLTLWGSETETLIRISGLNDIAFEGILFRGNGYGIKNNIDHSQAAYDAPSCVFCEASEGFAIRNCEFRDIAACAVFMGSAVTDSCVDSCLFENIGAQAVYVRGENVEADSPRITKNIDIVNNSISGYGRVYYNAVGILVIHAGFVNVCNNEIHDGYYTAISVGWVWGYAYSVTDNNRICDNLIYNIGQGWLSDMGGIYTLGIQHGTVISGNVIHNVAADPGEGGYGGWGIYLDEGSSYILVEKNLVYSCGSDAYHLHYGSYNTVSNNIFALSGESLVRVVSAPQRVTPADGGKLAADFSHNILLADGKVRAYSYLNDNAYTDTDSIFWDVSNGSDVYVGYYAAPNHAMGIRTAARKGYVSNPHVIDPCFKNASAYDFSFKDTSAVTATGFVPWDYSSAGTKAGTTVGFSAEGGKTPYNAETTAVEYTPSSEPFHLIMELINTIIELFTKLFSAK